MALPMEAIYTPPIQRASEKVLKVKGLICGESGAGKTGLLCTAAEGYKTLLLIVEKNVSDTTIIAMRRLYGVDPDIWDINRVEDVEEAYDFLSVDDTYEVVGLDSLTDIQQKCLRSEVVRAYTRSPDRLDPVSPDRGTWFRSQEIMRDLIVKFRDLDKHVFMTALLGELRQEGELPKMGPLLQPKGLAYEAPRFFNMVGILKAVVDVPTQQAYRGLLVGLDPKYATKNPANLLEEEIDDPNLTQIIQIITRGGE